MEATKGKFSKVIISGMACILIQSCQSWWGSSKRDGLDQTSENSKAMFIAKDCESSKEFITTFNFLNDSKDLGFKREQAVETAANVARGCSGAAKRFISAVLLLEKAGFPAATSIKTGVQLAQRSDDTADAFAVIFKMSYLKDGLDLDPLTSLDLALRLSVNYPGNPIQASDDFKTIAQFCFAPDGLALPRPQCAEVAIRGTMFALRTDKGIGKQYIDMIKVLTDPQGTNLTTSDAREVTESLLAVNPFATDNFLATMRFAISDRGLRLDRKQAVNLAKRIAAMVPVVEIVKAPTEPKDLSKIDKP